MFHWEFSFIYTFLSWLENSIKSQGTCRNRHELSNASFIFLTYVCIYIYIYWKCLKKRKKYIRKRLSTTTLYETSSSEGLRILPPCGNLASCSIFQRVYTPFFTFLSRIRASNTRKTREQVVCLTMTTIVVLHPHFLLLPDTHNTHIIYQRSSPSI